MEDLSRWERALSQCAEADSPRRADQRIEFLAPFEKVPGDIIGKRITGLAGDIDANSDRTGWVLRIGLNEFIGKAKAPHFLAKLSTQIVVAHAANDDDGMSEL